MSTDMWRHSNRRMDVPKSFVERGEGWPDGDGQRIVVVYNSRLHPDSLGTLALCNSYPHYESLKAVHISRFTCRT